MGVEVAGEGFGSTAEVSDAHGTCIGVTAFLPECLDLHCTCERCEWGGEEN